MGEKSRDGRFEIFEHSVDDDSYFYSDRDTTWHVASLETGDALHVLSGSTHSGREGSSQAGVATVEFDQTETAVVATGHDGTVERVELPAVIERVEGGRAILLRYLNGRTERRPRRAVMIHLKFGDTVWPLPLVGDPVASREA
jgi:hypothetical protein